MFLIGTPDIAAARLMLSSGKALEITIKNPGKGKIYVRSACFNGKSLSDFMLPARELMRGGTLVFEMS